MRRKKHDDDAKHSAESPPDDFCAWWNPTGIDPESGAARGGHQDAFRVWARKDEGRWTRRHYGMTAVDAWKTALFRDEYEDWVNMGRPERTEEFVSLSLTIGEQRDAWKSIGTILKGMPKPPRLRRRDVQREQLAAGHTATLVEPLDEKGERNDDEPIDF